MIPEHLLPKLNMDTSEGRLHFRAVEENLIRLEAFPMLNLQSVNSDFKYLAQQTKYDK